MPIDQLLNDRVGDWIVSWYDYAENQHAKRFRTFREAEKFSDDLDGSVVYHVKQKDDGTTYRAMVY